MTKPIRVAIIDDSLLMRQILSDLLSHTPGFEVVAVAADAREGRQVIKDFKPDVLTLDVEMPGMDGLTFLEKIMTLRPMPVVMVSSLTRAGADATVRALDLGAVDCVAKPDGSDGQGFEKMAGALIAKLRIAAGARVGTRPLETPAAALPSPARRVSGRLLAIGASTGGVERIRAVVAALPADTPPVVVTQHIGPSYVPSFAARLDKLSPMTFSVAQDGEVLQPGHGYVAPGDRHLSVAREGGRYVSKLSDSNPVSGHRPSVDVLFQSVATAAGRNAIGVILSGMGRDGADGLKAMRDAGAHTIGETETSCVVYGMPRAAKEIGAVMVELPLPRIPAEMLRALEAPSS